MDFLKGAVHPEIKKTCMKRYFEECWWANNIGPHWLLLYGQNCRDIFRNIIFFLCSIRIRGLDDMRVRVRVKWQNSFLEVEEDKNIFLALQKFLPFVFILLLFLAIRASDFCSRCHVVGSSSGSGSFFFSRLHIVLRTKASHSPGVGERRGFTFEQWTSLFFFPEVHYTGM